MTRYSLPLMMMPGNFTDYYPDMTKEDFVRMVADRLPDYFSEDIKITDILCQRSGKAQRPA